MTRLAGRDVRIAAAQRDEVACARIAEAHDDAMYRLCVAVSRDQTIAADAVHAAWSIAWRKLDTVHDPGRLKSWLVAIAVNESKTLLDDGASPTSAPHRRTPHRIDRWGVALGPF